MLGIPQRAAPYLFPAPGDTDNPATGAPAIRALSAAYGSPARIWMWIGCTIVAVPSALGFGFLESTFRSGLSVATVIDFLLALILILLLVGAVGWLIVLARSGSAIVRSLAMWIRGPAQSGHVPASWSGWVQTRLVLFAPPVFLRVAAAALSALGAAFSIYGVFAAISDGMPLVSVFVVWSALSISQCILLFSSVTRIVNARAAYDIVWRTLRG